MRCLGCISAIALVAFLLSGRVATNPKNTALAKKYISYTFKEISYGATWVSQKVSK